MVSVAGVPASATTRFDVLDALRGLCALLVVLFHFSSNGFIVSLPIVKNGWLFVDYFFVLSGFVITHSYLDRLADDRISVSRFMGLRLGRIYPLHIFVLLAFLSLELLLVFGGESISRYVSREPFSGSRDIGSLVQSIFLVQAFGVGNGGGWNIPAWSIAAELWTYLLFALIFALGRRVIVQISSVLALVAVVAMMSYSENLDITLNGGILRCVYGFSVGVLTYAAFRRFGGTSGNLLEVVVAVAMVAFVSLASGVFTFVAPVIFAATIYVFANQDGAISRVLMAKPFQFLGLISYSIYMIHWFVQGRVGDVLQLLKLVEITVAADGKVSIDGPPLVGDLITLAMLSVVVAGAYVTYSLVEKPGQALAKRLLGTASRRPKESAVA